MKCLILAAGYATRLYPLTENFPKPLLKVCEKSILDWLVDDLVETTDIDEFVVISNHKFATHFEEWKNNKEKTRFYEITVIDDGTSTNESRLGAVKDIQLAVEKLKLTDDLLVMAGDNVLDFSLSKFVEFAKKKDTSCVMCHEENELKKQQKTAIITVDKNDLITSYEEKPKEPKSTLASMGIYVFSWEKLRKYLIENENANTGSKDFGKDIIPAMLANDERLFAYEFEGYWKDVGTLDSLWEANMDLLSPSVPLNLYDPNWKVYSRHNNMPPQYIGKNAHVENSMITEGSVVDGTVDFSIISSGVTIEEGASVKYSIVMPGTTIKKNAVVEYAIIGENCVVESDAMIGMNPESVPNRDDWGIAVLGHNITISSGKRVLPKEIISENL